MIINRDYITSRISFFITNKQKEFAQTEKDLKLYRIKYGIPSWIRNIVFSPFNPLYAIYRSRKKTNTTSSNYAQHPVTVDFMRYCFENDIQLDTRSFFSEEDDILIQNFVDSRIKSILSKYDNPELSNEQLKCLQIEKDITSGAKKWKKGYHIVYEHINYYMPENTFSYTVLECHYGLKYMPETIKEYIKGKDFLDVGALFGDAGLMFLQYNPDRIFAYEPVTDSYQKLIATIEMNSSEKIIPVKKGIGDESKSLDISIDVTNTGASTLLNTLSTIKNPETETINISTIDDECHDKKVGLIKMDIEGFEYYAIKGGLNTIKRDKPVLLISIYHTGKDFFEIPPMIKSHVPEYKFKFLDLSPHRPLSDKIIIGYI